MPAAKRKAPTINLLPTDEGDATMLGRVIRWILGTFRVLVILVELLVIVGFLSRFYLDSKNSDLSDEISQKRALIESYLPFENDFKNAQKKLSVFGNYAYSQDPMTDYLDQVTKNLTTDLQLTQVLKTGNDITVVVIGKSEQSIANYASKLKQESLLGNIAVLSIEGVQGSSFIKATLQTQKQQTNAEQ